MVRAKETPNVVRLAIEREVLRMIDRRQISPAVLKRFGDLPMSTGLLAIADHLDAIGKPVAKKE
jgi:hypothetical protein